MRAPNFLAGATIDRAAHRRKDEGWLAERLRDPETRVLPLWRSQNLVVGEDEPRAAAISALEAAGLLAAEGAQPVLLGMLDGAACFALDLSALDDPSTALAAAPGSRFVGLREVGALLPRGDGALLAYARAMMSWHRRHRFCGACGGATSSRDAGHLRVCSREGCGEPHFPRTDPAVIMLVTSGDRCLLGRQASWPPGVYSTLAGFVEPGESLEEAVAREVREETGVTLREVRYHSSQPWPFPGSLMLGFTAAARSDDLALDRDELEDARWLSRTEVRAGTVRLPTPLSIARRLIDDWAT